MAVQLFRKNERGEIESQLFDPFLFADNLKSGWVLFPAQLEEDEKEDERQDGNDDEVAVEEKKDSGKRGRGRPKKGV